MMPVMVAFALKVHFFIKCFLQVYACLVGKAKHYKNHICQLFSQIFVLITFFFTLLTITTGYNTGYFAYFFGKLCHISKFIKVAHTVLFYPVIYVLLCVFDIHYNVFY